MRINATMDEDLVARIDAFAASRYEDRSTAIRQLVAYRSGRISLREFAASLGLGIWSAHDLLRAEGVPVAGGQREETRSTLQDVLRGLQDDPPVRTAQGTRERA
jgi:hypothetical protein